MDGKLKALIAERIEFRIGKYHAAQPLLKDIEKILDEQPVAGWLTFAHDKIGWVPNAKLLLELEPMKRVPVHLGSIQP